MTSSKPMSKKFIGSFATNQSKIRKITLATLIVAVSLSVAIEIGYTTCLAQGYTSSVDSSLAQGYTSSVDSYRQTLCTGKVLELFQKGIIRDVGGFSGAIYECTHTKYADSIYGNVTNA